LEVLESADTTKYGQLQAQAVTVGPTVGGSNGTFFYQDVIDRAGFINNSGGTKSLAYTVDSNIAVSSLTVSSINNAPYLGFRGGQFYRTTNQNLPVSANALTFTSAKPWNSPDFVQINPSTFTCSTTGTYQVGVNTTINAGSGLWSSLNKSLTISQDRTGALSVVINTCAVEQGNYGQSVSAVLDIAQGDDLQFLTGQTLTTGSTISLGLSGGIDYNTFWDYQLLRIG
jgi:hypothetical protein